MLHRQHVLENHQHCLLEKERGRDTVRRGWRCNRRGTNRSRVLRDGRRKRRRLVETVVTTITHESLRRCSSYTYTTPLSHRCLHPYRRKQSPRRVQTGGKTQNRRMTEDQGQKAENTLTRARTQTNKHTAGAQKDISLVSTCKRTTLRKSPFTIIAAPPPSAFRTQPNSLNL